MREQPAAVFPLMRRVLLLCKSFQLGLCKGKSLPEQAGERQDEVDPPVSWSVLTQETLCSPPFLQVQHEKGVEVVVGKSRRTDAQELVLGLSRASCSLQSCSHRHGTAVLLGTLQPTLSSSYEEALLCTGAHRVLETQA